VTSATQARAHGAADGEPASGGNERGAALSVMALAAALLLVAFGYAYVQASSDVGALAALQARRAQARAAAHGALEVALVRYLPAPASGVLEIGPAFVKIKTSRVDAQRSHLRVQAEVGEGADRVVVEMSATATRSPDGAAVLLELQPESGADVQPQ
jgi:hypothetical protein